MRKFGLSATTGHGVEVAAPSIEHIRSFDQIGDVLAAARSTRQMFQIEREITKRLENSLATLGRA